MTAGELHRVHHISSAATAHNEPWSAVKYAVKDHPGSVVTRVAWA
jgi:hypothetical protein